MEIRYTLNDIANVAETLLSLCETKIILLYGNMGVGKTTLVKCIAEQLGVSNSISSPTYSIVNEHTTKEGLLYHFDLYRINNIEELYDFGIEDYLYTNNWIIIEWPEIAEPLLPNAYNTICISEISETQRLLKLITKE